MRIRGVRLAPVFVAALVPFAGLAIAEDGKVPDHYKCDLRKLLAPEAKGKLKVGEAVSEERDELDVRRMRETVEGEEEGKLDEEHVALHVECVRVVVAADEKAKTSESQVRILKWKRTKKGSPDDTSLEGKVIVVRHADARRSFLVVAPDGTRAKVSDEALGWARKEYGPKKTSDEEEKKFNLLTPEKPVAPDTEWTGDAAILRELFVDTFAVDVARSSVKGKFSKVRLDGKTLRGTIALDMTAQLESVPQTSVAWTEGGAMEMKIELDGPLDEPNSAHVDARMTMRLRGKVRVEADGGARIRELDVKSEKKEKNRPAKAPEVVKLQFDPEADYRWNVQDWASGDEADATPKVGDRSFLEIESTSTTEVTANGNEAPTKKVVVSARIELEVMAVKEKKESERKATIKRWKMTQNDEVDESLEGKTVLLERAPKAGQPAWRVVDAKGKKVKVTDAARQFIEGELVKVRTRALQLDGLHELLGNEPIVPDKEITIDPKTAMKKLFGDGQELDVPASKAVATLRKVRAVAGDHEGRLEGRISLKLRTIPGAPGSRFDDPGDCNLLFGFEGSLDRGKTGAGVTTVSMDYSGKGVVNSKQGPVTFEPHVVTKRTIRTGPLPPKTD